jgi:hypothetical protein
MTSPTKIPYVSLVSLIQVISVVCLNLHYFTILKTDEEENT